MSVVFPIVVVVAIVFVVAAVAYTAYLAEKKRTEELKQLAEGLGFEFEPYGNAAFLQGLSNFHLFSQGHSRKVSNLLRGMTQELEVAIFDYTYITGSGKHRHVWNHSVICFQFEGPGLPPFSLRPENVGHKIGAWFGYQDIDFDTHSDFSRKYLLRGGDENAVRGLFTGAVLDFYEEKPGVCTEGAGHTLVFYRQAVRVRPQAIRSFMEEGFAVLSLYRSAGGQATSP
jgi:hypothetical protein